MPISHFIQPIPPRHYRDTYTLLQHEVKYHLMRPVQQPQSQGQTQSGVGCGDIVRSVGRDGLLKAGSTPGHCHIHIAANNGNQAISRHIIVDKVALLVTGPHREGDTVVCFFF